MEPNLTNRLLSHCESSGTELRPGVSPMAVAAFEAAHQVVLPHDLKTFLLTADGSGHYNPIDGFMFCFWSLSEFISLAEEFPDATCFETPKTEFLFADSMLHCPAYAIRLFDDPRRATPVLAIYSDNQKYEFYQVSDSFTEFVEQYLAEGFVL